MNTQKKGMKLARKSAYAAGDPVIRPFIRDQMIAKGVQEITACMATNESPYPPSPKVLQALYDSITHVNLYPDPSSTLLRRKLAERCGLTEKMITVGNGADEIVYTIGKAFIEEGENAVISTPCYPSTIRAIESMGGHVHRIGYRADFTCDIERMLDAIDKKTKLAILCTPGNPNSRVIMQEELDWFMERVPPDCLVVMDEAYKEFINIKDAADPMIYCNDERNIVYIRTFSKFYCLAGLRVGYALGPEHIIDILRRSLPPFPVNTLAQAAAMAVLDDDAYNQSIFERVVESREYLTKALLDIGFAPVAQSQTNFLFVDTCHVPSQLLVDKLFQAGIHIRGAIYPPFSSHVRITLGTMEQNKRLVAIAEEVSKEFR